MSPYSSPGIVVRQVIGGVVGGGDERFTLIEESKLGDLTGYVFAATAQLTAAEVVASLEAIGLTAAQGTRLLDEARAAFRRAPRTGTRTQKDSPT